MKTDRRSRPASIPDVVWQLWDNCSALWTDRELAWRSLSYRSTLEDLERIDARIDAHLDALRTCGSDGWRSASDGLERCQPGDVFAACVLALEAPPRERARATDLVLGRIGDLEECVRPLSVALDWINSASFDESLRRLLAERSLTARAAALRATAMRGIGRPGAIAAALECDSLPLVSAGCWAAVRLGRRDMVGRIESHLQSPRNEIRATAAKASTLLGSSRGVEALKAVASDSASLLAEDAGATLFRALPPHAALAVHRELFGTASPSRTSLKAAAASGVTDLLPMMLAHMDDEPWARLAAGGFSTVTGARLEAVAASAECGSPRGSGPTEDPDDERVDLDPDEGVPWPDPGAIKGWWKAHAAGFRPATRYMEGAIVGRDVLAGIARDGRQVSRAAAAELLALEGAPMPDVGAPAFRQREWLGRDEAWP